MKKLFITGASGFLGWHCSHFLPDGWKAVGTYNEHREGIHPYIECCQLDLTDKDALWRILKTVKPDAVFHLAAHSGTAYCEDHPDQSRQLNVEATTFLTEMCADLKTKFLFTSSEQVFDGRKGSYSEADIPQPKNEYGKQKLAAEMAVQEIYPEAAILRLAVLYGEAAPAAQSFFNQWLEAWNNLASVTAFYDEVRQFLSAGSAAEALYHLLDQGAEGIFHIGGAEAMSRYDFGRMAIEELGLVRAKLEAKSQQEVDMPAYRPPNLSLDLSNLESTGFRPTHPEQELVKWKPNLDTETTISLN